MDFYRHLFTNDGPGKELSFALIHLISIIFTFQSLLTAYSSSTYLEQFINPQFVGLVFAAAAFGAIIITLTLPRLLRRIGNVATVLFLMVLITISLILIGYAPTPIITIGAFIALMALSPQIYFNIDIFLETLIGTHEGTTGSRRGLILALMSVAAFFSPLVMGHIIGDSTNLHTVYYVAAAVGLLFIAIIIIRFRQFFDPEYITVRVRDLLALATLDKNISTVLTTQFLLQFFYTWAIIYFPLYLATVIGFEWNTIGKIIAAGLFAFVVFEYPIGLIADRHLGEKEMMALGFVVLAISSASIIYMDGASVTGWMLLMFVSRFGASLVEVTTESYFFKQVKSHESTLISLFRLMRPVANLAGALVGSLLLLFLPFNLIFIALGFIMALGAFITIRLTDTR